MIIKINSDLKEEIDCHDELTEDKLVNFYSEIKTKVENKDQKCFLIRGISDSKIENIQMGYIRFLSSAYSLHQSIILAPHDIWYLILTELSKIIEANVEKCRPMFTNSQEKIEIRVLKQEEERINPLFLLDELTKLVPVDTNLFFPNFSTTTIKSQIASAATFAGSLKHYYDYCMLMCGIREIKITGTINDWNKISSNLKVIESLFHKHDVTVHKEKVLVDWYNDVQEITNNIYKCLNGEDNVEFMKGIFTQKNVGSGSQLRIDGWITKVFCEVCDFPLITNFSSNVGILPYKDLDNEREFIGVHGLFLKKRDEDGFVYPDFEEIIFEKVK
jgi:Domain of unknown function (DUF4419)